MLSKSSLYALKAVKLLSDGQRLGAQRLSELTGAPANYMGKILGILVRQKLLTSRRGADGGVCLSTAPNKISLSEIVEPFERIDDWPQCIFGDTPCDDHSACEDGRRWCMISRNVHDWLKNTYISDLSMPIDISLSNKK